MTTSVSVSRFKKAYPEFKDTSPELCSQKLAAASLRVNSNVFGENAIDAVMLKAAHLLSISPDGELVRLKTNEQSDLYEREFKTLVREKTVGVGRVT